MATVHQQEWQGAAVYTLENDKFSVSVIPEIGNNVYRMWDKIARREVLRTPESVAALKESPGHYGIPLMLPPSRIRGGTFTFNGKKYQLEINTPHGHHIHGFLRMRPWKVTNTEAQGDTASVTAVFRTTDFPELADQYPHDLTVEARTELSGSSLIQTFAVRNASAEPAPFGFGLHTWFMLDGEPEAWTLQLPVEDIWELGPDLLPSGKRLPLGVYERIGEGINLKGQNMDNAFRIGANPALAVLSRPGYTIRYAGNEPFTQWVIYTKGEARDYICLEPYTWTPDAPNLDAAPELTGFRAIGPGEELRLQVTMDIAHG